MSKKPTATERYGVVGGWWIKNVGAKVTKGGSIRAATHYLAKVVDDPRGIMADEKASALKAQWSRNEGTTIRDGRKVWADEAHTAVELPQSQANPPTMAPMVAAPSGPTIREAAEAFIKEQYIDRGADEQTVITSGHRLFAAIAHIGDDMPLGAVDETKVRAAVLALCRRPDNRKRYGERKPILIRTANDWLKTLKRFLEWASEVDDYGFQLPKRFHSTFKANRPQKTAEEIRASANRIDTGVEVDHYAIDELITLYCHAQPRQRGWILCMLNMGFANEELNSLHIDECKGLSGAAPYVARIRGKTIRIDRTSDGVFAKWSLWKETAAYLLTEIGGRKNDYALKTHHGNALITPTSKGRKDAVYVSWQRLYERIEGEPMTQRVCGIANPKAVEALKGAGYTIPRWLPPKFIRKSAAYLIRMQYGAETATAFLSHADDGAGDASLSSYTGRSWDKVADATAYLRKQLQPLFDAAKKFDKKAAAAREHLLSITLHDFEKEAVGEFDRLAHLARARKLRFMNKAERSRVAALV